MKKLLTMLFTFTLFVSLSQSKDYVQPINVIGYSFISFTSSVGSYSLSEWMLDKGSKYGSIDPYTVPVFSSGIFYGALESILYISIEDYRPNIINIGVAIITSAATMAIKKRCDKKNKSKLKL